MFRITSEEISTRVAEICKGFESILAAIAMGSCARGEETYFINRDGDKEMMSDFEMLIIIKDDSETEKISGQLNRYRANLIPIRQSENFDLEWAFKTQQQLKTLDKRFIFFETKAAGKVIYGERDVLNYFPDINTHNLNYSELNTVIIHRLYHVLRDIGSTDERYKKYLIARNSLDFATAILPLTGVLEASYSKRMDDIERIAEQYQIPDALIKRQRDYLVMKRNYSSSLYEHYEYAGMLQAFIDDFQLLKSLQCKLQNGVLFRENRRRMLSAVFHVDIKNIIICLHWKERLSSLCDELFQMLEVGTVQETQLAMVKDQMMELFGYC